MRVSQDSVVYLVIVFLSMIISMIFLSSKLKRNLIIAQNLTNVRYAVKGEGTVTFYLDSGSLLDAHDVLYVPGLKKKFLSVSAMEDRGFVITFQQGQVLIRPLKVIPDNAVVIGVREGTLYKLQGKFVPALVHNSDNLCELWLRRLGHLHYKEFFILRDIVTGLLAFNIEQ
jgi:hypothetical protein